jgi:hypothetical protein
MAAAKKFMAARPPKFAEWRASVGVQTALEQQAIQYPEYADYLHQLATGIADARAAGKPFFTEAPAIDLGGGHPAPLPEPATKAQVFFLTDGRCMSACLDFADLLLDYAPGVIHVGLPTSADTQYLQVRQLALPSGRDSVWLPMKVWRNRPRGNEPYIPKHRFPGEIADTAALESWIRELVLHP